MRAPSYDNYCASQWESRCREEDAYESAMNALRERAEDEARECDERFVEWLLASETPYGLASILARFIGNADRGEDEWLTNNGDAGEYIKRYVEWRVDHGAAEIEAIVDERDRAARDDAACDAWEARQ